MLHELQTALFLAFLPEACEHCSGPDWRCETPHALTADGDLLIDPPEGLDWLVSWPRCPRSFNPYYLLGYSLIRLDEALRFGWESGRLQVDKLSAGLSRLFRHWHVLSSGKAPHIELMAEARAAARAKEGKGGR